MAIKMSPNAEKVWVEWATWLYQNKNPTREALEIAKAAFWHGWNKGYLQGFNTADANPRQPESMGR